MPRLLSPDGACKSADMYDGRRYNGALIDVSNPTHVRALRAQGYTLAGITSAASKAAGFECTACTFKSFFRKCSRCGGACERPDLAA
jgi:hypothetical protein